MSIRREEILRSARELYLSEGIEGFSMRKLARRVGCTAPALYRYYESKEEVLQDVVGEAYRLFSRYLYRALEGRSEVERFVMAARGYFEFAMEQPALYEVIYLPATVLGVAGRAEAIAEQAAAVGQFWADRVRELMDAGYLKKGDPHEVSVTLWGQAHGLISLYHRGVLGVESPKEFRELMAASFSRVFEGLGTPSFSAILEGSVGEGERASPSVIAG